MGIIYDAPFHVCGDTLSFPKANEDNAISIISLKRRECESITAPLSIW